MQLEREQIKWVRRSVAIVALVQLAEIVVNYLLYPILNLIPVYEDGSFGAEVYDLVLYLILFAVPFCVAAKRCGMSAGDLMGRETPSASVFVMTIGLTMGWSLAAGWLAAGIEAILNTMGLTESSDPYILPTTAAAALVQFIALAIVPPLVEELCFRGFYLNLTVPSMGTWGAIVLTAFVFWTAHYSIEILPLAFGFGIIGGYIRQKYGSLLPSMCGHFAVNGIYWLVNFGWDKYGANTGILLSGAVSLTELAMGVIGVILFIKNGCLRELCTGKFGTPAALRPGQLVYAVLTCVPALLVILTVIVFTARGLEIY